MPIPNPIFYLFIFIQDNIYKLIIVCHTLYIKNTSIISITKGNGRNMRWRKKISFGMGKKKKMKKEMFRMIPWGYVWEWEWKKDVAMRS